MDANSAFAELEGNAMGGKRCHDCHSWKVLASIAQRKALQRTLTDGRSGLVVTAELGKTQSSFPGRETHHSRRLKALLALFEIVWNAESIGYTSESRDVLLY